MTKKPVVIRCGGCSAVLDLKAKEQYTKLLQKRTLLSDGSYDLEFLYWFPLCGKCAKEDQEKTN